MVEFLPRIFTVGNVNRIGMILEFFSFWFAAPELLGEDRLRRLRDSFGRGVKALPSLTAKVLCGILLFGAPGILIVVYQRRVFSYLSWSFSHWSHLLVGNVVEEVIGIAFLFLAVAFEFFAFEFLTKHVAKPILTKLADNNRLRQNSLVLAAILFVAGFMLQFIATFL